MQFLKILRVDTGWTVRDFISSVMSRDDKIRVGWQGEESAAYLAFTAGLRIARISFNSSEFSGDEK
jgi:hypothetical protein